MLESLLTSRDIYNLYEHVHNLDYKYINIHI